MLHYYHQMENYKPAVDMVTACKGMVSSVLVVVVEIVEDKGEHYCDVVLLRLFDQSLKIRNCTCNKHSDITTTNRVVSAVNVE